MVKSEVEKERNLSTGWTSSTREHKLAYQNMQLDVTLRWAMKKAYKSTSHAAIQWNAGCLRGFSLKKYSTWKLTITLLIQLLKEESCSWCGRWFCWLLSRKSSIRSGRPVPGIRKRRIQRGGSQTWTQVGLSFGVLYQRIQHCPPCWSMCFLMFLAQIKPRRQ